MSDFALSISSPNGETELRITVAPDHELYRVSPGTLRAEIVRRGARVVDCRTIGLQCDGAPPLMSCLHARVIDRQSRDQTWSPVLSENATVPDRHESVVLSLEEALEPRRRLEMEFRVYDDAVALRYRVPRDATAGISVRQESVRLQFAEGATGYQQTYPEDRYQLTPLEQLHTPTEAPLVIRTPPCPFVGLLEAANLDWPGLKFTADARRPGSVRFHLTGEATLDPGAVSPWRVIRVVDRAIDLVGTSDLIATLCPPCAVSDTRWIRPGKAIRDITLSTAGGLACIEFARRRGLRHILYDAGWYGHEYDDAADARQVSPDPDRTSKVPGHGGLDLRTVIAEAARHDIGVFLYVNRRALERQLDALLPLYQSWGVAGIKFGFVETGSSRWTAWLTDAVRRCAEYQLMVDIHDFYRPTGLSRTFPNLLTQEGTRGNEHYPDSVHNCTLPYTRFIAGAADYTICYRIPRLKTTSAHQLAMAAVYFSPLQLLYWYSRPDQYVGLDRELDWFDHVPTTFDQTLPIAGEIGQYIVLARRKEQRWYLGVLNADAERTINIDLDRFGARSATVFQDAPDGAVDVQTVQSKSLTLRLAPHGGAAIRIE